MTKSTITREWLQEAISDIQTRRDNGSISWDDERENVLQALELALAAMDSESGCLPLDYLQGHKDGLEWAAQLAEANHPETGDWLYDDLIELAKAIRKGPDMPPAQLAPVVSEDLYKLANHIASSKNGLPDEWQGWAEELESDIRRAAMLQAGALISEDTKLAELVTTANKLGNSPVIPDGYVMVPKEPTGKQWAAGVQAFDSGMDKVTRIYKAMLAAAPQEVKGE
ncbi:hypothetical protein ACLIKC_06695 [Klebsiella aerogenes]|uniref:hypothetical protein n=1 Tax=Klebsiella aerogenes TaxID=548 RepID=UPI003A8EF8BA